MKKIIYLFPVLFLFLFSCTDSSKNKSNQESEGSSKDLTQFVNPFIGTGGHGHTYPGATLPFGMVQLSPDTRLEGWDGCSGYHYSDSVVYGFSHTHLSGTGVPDYGDILFMPTTGKIQFANGDDNPDNGYASRFSHEKEIASPGFYKTHLDDYNIDVELSTSKRVGFHKYTFASSDQANIIIDLLHRDKVIVAGITKVSDTEIEGFRRSTAWANDQVIYFVAEFSKPFQHFQIEKEGNKINEEKTEGESIKAAIRFQTEENEEIYVKVGISAVDIDGARKNLIEEIPDWDFDKVKVEAEQSWNKELNKIQVEGNKDDKIVFYTSMYHAFLAPNLFMDVDGRYRGRDLEVHQSSEFENHTVFSLWDTYRATHPLYTIVQQEKTYDFINTMLVQYEQGGRLPVWELAANETECMIGYHSIPVIVDAYMKGLRDFDIEKAYEAMKHSAELDHFGLESYKKNGYIPAQDEAESVSKTLEYAYDDWCIAIMAKELGYDEDYQYYIKRAQSYKNIFDPSTGFMRAKMNGRWFTPFDPKEVNFNYTEANSWQYSFYVPQDISGLINMIGGEDKFEERLDQLFSESSQTTGRHQSDITGLVGQYAHGNEPSHHMAYLYNYIGKPWESQKLTAQIMNELYTKEADGLCGNEDCGQMSSWYVVSAMGFYPVTPGSNLYAFGTPIFKKSVINLESGNTFTISANNVSKENIYIQSASLNGKEYNKSFIMHQEIMEGGELIFEMGSEPNHDWGSKVEDIPVSKITENLITPGPFVIEGAKTFYDSTKISMGTIDADASVYFTTDGTIPDLKSNHYNGEFYITSSTKLSAIAHMEGMPTSKVLMVIFTKIPKGRSITLGTKYANQYAAGGDIALIDFIRGPKNYKTGSWQGYEGVNIEAVVDLGSIKLLNKFETGFLQDNNSWIFMPEEVSYEISKDGINYQHIGTVKNDIPQNEMGTILKNFTVNFATKARYIKMTAKNIGTCPDWHKGAGNEAWIFADEIVIE
jgi:predicted alpha-1,2-mannosidase